MQLYLMDTSGLSIKIAKSRSKYKGLRSYTIVVSSQSFN